VYATMPGELVKLVIEASTTWLEGLTGELGGMVQMLGGGMLTNLEKNTHPTSLFWDGCVQRSCRCEIVGQSLQYVLLYEYRDHGQHCYCANIFDDFDVLPALLFVARDVAAEQTTGEPFTVTLFILDRWQEHVDMYSAGDFAVGVTVTKGNQNLTKRLVVTSTEYNSPNIHLTLSIRAIAANVRLHFNIYNLSVNVTTTSAPFHVVPGLMHIQKPAKMAAKIDFCRG